MISGTIEKEREESENFNSVKFNSVKQPDKNLKSQFCVSPMPIKEKNEVNDLYQISDPPEIPICNNR